MRDVPLSKRPESAILGSQSPGIGGMSVGLAARTKQPGPVLHGNQQSAGSAAARGREIEYHRRRAAEHASEATRPVNLMADKSSARYRWLNNYWVILRKAKDIDMTGKRVLVIGGGFGDDAIRLAYLG
jgi:hypothetical protein